MTVTVGEPTTLPVSPTRYCRCVKDHVPNALVVHSHHIHPLGEGGPDTAANRVWLCPTAHYNVHLILSHMLRHQGSKPRGRANAYQLELAQRGYNMILEARSA